MFLSSAEIARGTQGAVRLLQRDPSAPLNFDNTIEACLRSFRVMVPVAPLYALTVAIAYSQREVAADDLEIVIVHALYYVVDWLLFPVLFYEIARRYRWLDRYARYIGALNWIALPWSVVVVAASALISILPPPAESAWPALIDFLVECFSAYWFIVTTRLALGAGWPASFGLLVLNVLPSFLLSLKVDSFLGVAPLAGS